MSDQIVFGYITSLSAYDVQITVFDENVPNKENIDEIINNPSYLIKYIFKIKFCLYKMILYPIIETTF